MLLQEAPCQTVPGHTCLLCSCQENTHANDHFYLAVRAGRIKNTQVTSQVPFLKVAAQVDCSNWDTKGNPNLSRSTSEEKLAVPVQTRNIMDLRLNCLFKEPQHCCSWQEHRGRAMETWCQRSEDLNHPPILLLSSTPQSKKSRVSQQRLSDKKTVRAKDKVKQGDWHRHRENE